MRDGPGIWSESGAASATELNARPPASALERAPRRILLLVNPAAASGRVRSRFDRFLVALGRQPVICERVFTQYPRHATELARQASDKFDVIAAVGGDGTVNEVANGLLQAGEPRAVLGVVPFGTGNDVAQQIGIHTLSQAVAALTHGQPRALDVIEVHYQELGQGIPPATFHPARAIPPLDPASATAVGARRHYALLFAAVGFAGELIKRTTPRVKSLFGPRFCYSVGFFRALWGFRAPRMRVRVDGREFNGPMFHVCAGNSEYGGGGIMRLSPGAKMDDGQLDICLIEDLGRLRTLRYFPHLLKGTHIGHPKVTYFPGTILTVDSDPATELQLDGDLVGWTPAIFQIRPRALRVMVNLNGLRARLEYRL